MSIAGQPEEDTDQDHHNNGQDGDQEKLCDVHVCQHRGVGRGCADRLEHIPCLVGIGPVASVRYQTMSGNNLPIPKALSAWQALIGTPPFMDVEDVLEPANEFKVTSREAEERSRWITDTAKERHCFV